MPGLSSSHPSIIAYGSQSATGGTCFLDLPFELRTMVYDLSMSNRYDWRFPSPGQPKPTVLGINLLRTCRQIRHETQGRVWYIELPLEDQSDKTSIDIGLALTCMPDAALARIVWISLTVVIDPSTLSVLGPINLQGLTTLKTLRTLHIYISVGTLQKIAGAKTRQDLENTVILTGLVTQMLPQIPKEVYVDWGLLYRDKDSGSRYSDGLLPIAEKFKCLRGSDCEPRVSNDRKELDISPR
ncbi:hypothetical protein QM012_009440 [Aureobasidium pullulans]|uniref:HET-domain-containing protein n=1 Tax=Aureobasidium pullulans TaxID=5580 RepID=A0ABR0THE6_AURPU